MKWIGIGLFSPDGKSFTLHFVGGKPKKFGTYQEAETFIHRNLTGNYSPVEINES